MRLFVYCVQIQGFVNLDRDGQGGAVGAAPHKDFRMRLSKCEKDYRLWF